ncbi:MAG TPA: HAD family hydrolase, partial [Trebonia sp.]|nr:HAD family hydrolase [Trebonia sp.]
VLAPPTQRPTYIAETLDALLQPYPDVTLTDDGAACGGWTALRAEGGHGAGLALKGSGSAIDGLRALAAAGWQAGERRTTDDIKAALEELAAAGLPT